LKLFLIPKRVKKIKIVERRVCPISAMRMLLEIKDVYNFII
jgi:hypothetical protein